MKNSKCNKNAMAHMVLCKFDGVHSSKEKAPKAKGQMKSELMCFPLIH